MSRKKTINGKKFLRTIGDDTSQSHILPDKLPLLYLDLLCWWLRAYSSHILVLYVPKWVKRYNGSYFPLIWVVLANLLTIIEIVI
jgi:hypothetical protein